MIDPHPGADPALRGFVLLHSAHLTLLCGRGGRAAECRGGFHIRPGLAPAHTLSVALCAPPLPRGEACLRRFVSGGHCAEGSGALPASAAGGRRSEQGKVQRSKARERQRAGGFGHRKLVTCATSHRVSPAILGTFGAQKCRIGAGHADVLPYHLCEAHRRGQ